MQLNEKHTEHEHATASLKVLLLVFAIVLVGALGYLVWVQNTAPDTTDNSAAVTKSTSKTETKANKTTFTDTALGFSITYPNTWKLTKRSIDASYETNYYDGDTAKTLALPASVRDYAWGIVVYTNSTVTKQLTALKEHAKSFATELQESSVTIGTEATTKFSFKQGATMRMSYFLAQGTTVFEITTDGSADQMTVAETFKFTK